MGSVITLKLINFVAWPVFVATGGYCPNLKNVNRFKSVRFYLRV